MLLPALRLLLSLLLFPPSPLPPCRHGCEHARNAEFGPPRAPHDELHSELIQIQAHAVQVPVGTLLVHSKVTKMQVGKQYRFTVCFDRAREIDDSEASKGTTQTGARVRRPRAGPVSPSAAATAWRRFPRLPGAAGFRARAPLGDLTPRNGAAPTAAAPGRPRRRHAAGCAPRPRFQRAVRCPAARAPVSALGGARSVGRLSAPPPPPPPASAPNPRSTRTPPA